MYSMLKDVMVFAYFLCCLTLYLGCDIM